MVNDRYILEETEMFKAQRNEGETRHLEVNSERSIFPEQHSMLLGIEGYRKTLTKEIGYIFFIKI